MCVRACVRACVCACVRACVCVCVYVYVRVFKHTQVRVRRCIVYLYMCACVRVFADGKCVWDERGRRGRRGVRGRGGVVVMIVGELEDSRPA